MSVQLQTLGLPTDVFQAVVAEAAQQHGTASSLRLISRSLAYGCGAALETGKTERQAMKSPSFPCVPRAALHTPKPQEPGCCVLNL